MHSRVRGFEPKDDTILSTKIEAFLIQNWLYVLLPGYILKLKIAKFYRRANKAKSYYATLMFTSHEVFNNEVPPRKTVNIQAHLKAIIKQQICEV